MAFLYLETSGPHFHPPNCECICSCSQGPRSLIIAHEATRAQATRNMLPTHLTCFIFFLSLFLSSSHNVESVGQPLGCLIYPGCLPFPLDSHLASMICSSGMGFGMEMVLQNPQSLEFETYTSNVPVSQCFVSLGVSCAIFP